MPAAEPAPSMRRLPFLPALHYPRVRLPAAPPPHP